MYKKAQLVFLSICLLLLPATASVGFSQSSLNLKARKTWPVPQKMLELSEASYLNKVHAIWIGQMAAATMGFQFEHNTASRKWVDDYPGPMKFSTVDDDWYYEMAAIRAFERYGIDMSVAQLGKQWLQNSCGTWGSSEQARLLMERGVPADSAGHPKYNKLWFTIGPQFSSDVYGALAPGLPNTAAKMARKYAHINGYAEGADGAVFVSGMISLGFTESDPKVIVRKAAKLISPKSPYRQCIDMVIRLAEQGKTARQVFDAVEDRWHIEYPATNNAVANGAIVATSVWFGQGDFLKTVNLAFSAADFTDADCNAANAASVIGAMHGMKAIPLNLVTQFHDRIKGDSLGSVALTPPVDESISGLAKRTVVLGLQVLKKNGAQQLGNALSIPIQEPVTQPAELFKLADLTRYWNADWELQRAGFGGAGGGMPGIRGITYLDKDVLATYPRDEVRGVVLQRNVKIIGQKSLTFNVGVDYGRAWELNVYIDNDQVLDKIIEGSQPSVNWQKIVVDLSDYTGKIINIRLYQRVLIDGREAGNAYWKDLKVL
jgi:hypothetical protein